MEKRIMSNWFSDASNGGEFNKNVEIASRFDGLFNLWKKVVRFDEKEGYTSYWEVIGVFEDEGKAKAGKEAYRAQIKAAKAAK
jgi:hypothetical protein